VTQPADRSRSWRCPPCGAVNSWAIRVCESCGAERLRVATAVPRPPDPRHWDSAAGAYVLPDEPHLCLDHPGCPHAPSTHPSVEECMARVRRYLAAMPARPRPSRVLPVLEPPPQRSQLERMAEAERQIRALMQAEAARHTTRVGALAATEAGESGVAGVGGAPVGRSPALMAPSNSDYVVGE